MTKYAGTNTLSEFLLLFSIEKAKKSTLCTITTTSHCKKTFLRFSFEQRNIKFRKIAHTGRVYEHLSRARILSQMWERASENRCGEDSLSTVESNQWVTADYYLLTYNRPEYINIFSQQNSVICVFVLFVQ